MITIHPQSSYDNNVNIPSRQIKLYQHESQNFKDEWLLHFFFKNVFLYDLASQSKITPCNKIDKPLVVYRFSGNVMTSITTLHYNIFKTEMRLQSDLNII